MRISVVNWSTEEQDVARSVAAILHAAAAHDRREHTDR
jgi:hypothetical protein